MPESTTELAPSNVLWDVIRYAIVAVAAGVLIWFYFFYTPIVYVSRESAGKTMGTDYIVKVARFSENADWDAVKSAVQDRLDALDQMMSTYKPDSEVCRFNTFASTEDWFAVSPETASVVQTASEISLLSEGAFDVTSAPLVRHWGFGADGKPRQNLSFDELASAAVRLKEEVGYQNLSVRLEPPALKKAIPELTIDLSAIAKGFAVDRVAELLEDHKVTDYLIEVGGEVRGKGKKNKDKDVGILMRLINWVRGKEENSKDKDWIVGIEKPVLESSHEFPGLQQAFALKDQSLATSGNYRQTVVIGERRVSHLIDPRSGLPVRFESEAGELVATAVVATDCTSADAWATALFVLGDQKGVEIANQHGIAVLFLLYNGKEIVEVSSRHWAK
jgi:thiamine biosynthesis lipoprotein